MSKKKFGIVLDIKKCLNCKACTVACKFENGVHVGDSNYRLWVTELECQGTYPNLTQDFEPSQCQHCQNTPCMTVCPTSATYMSEEGVVQIDYDRCILCKACMTACPYDARFESHAHHAIEKCTMCYHRISDKENPRDPACVETCPTKVRVFGDLADPKSEAAILLAENPYYQLKPEKNTKPRLFYIK